MARSEIDALEADGVRVEAQDVLDLQYASIRASSQPECGFDLSMGDPVAVGNVTLWPLTYAGAAFYRAVLPLFKDGASVTMYAYALANGHDAAAMSLRGASAVEAVSAWADTVTATFEQLAAAVAEVCKEAPGARPRKPSAKESAVRKEPLPILAQAMCGGTPAMWETQCSIEYVRHVVRVAQAKEGAKFDERAKWLRELARMSEDIRARAKEAANE